MTASNLFSDQPHNPAPAQRFLTLCSGCRRNVLRTIGLPAVLAASLGLTTMLAMPGAALAASELGPVMSLATCARMAEDRPDETLLAARRWQQQGGAEQAEYCQALAYFHQGEFRDAAELFEKLAPQVAAMDAVPTKGQSANSGNSPAMIAEGELLARAGWAWMRAGEPGRAEDLYNRALSRRPKDADLLIDRAFARAETERYWDALDDLDAALAIDPNRADAYLFRASTHRALSNDRQALADLERLLELRPGDPDALLLRGSIRIQAGDTDGARSDWRMVVKTSPDSEAGESAARNLDRLDAVEGKSANGKAR